MCVCLALPLAPCDVGDVCIVCWPSEEKRARHKQIKINPGPLHPSGRGVEPGLVLCCLQLKGPMKNLPVESKAFGCSVGVVRVGVWWSGLKVTTYWKGPFGNKSRLTHPFFAPCRVSNEF